MNNKKYIQFREDLFYLHREVEIELFEALWEDMRVFFSAMFAQRGIVSDCWARAQVMLDRFISIVFHRNEEGVLRLPPFLEVMQLADTFKLCLFDDRDLNILADREENIVIIPDGQDNHSPDTPKIFAISKI